MAKSSALGLALLCVVLVMSPLMVYSNKEITLYGTAIAGENVILVAGPGPNPNPRFGDVNVFDFPVRESIDTNSPIVGRIQGIAAVSSLDGTRVYFSDSLIIERGKYKVGTLQVSGILTIGISSQGPTYTGELGVSSGTVVYRFNYGYMDVQTVRQFPERNTTVLKIKVVLED